MFNMTILLGNHQMFHSLSCFLHLLVLGFPYAGENNLGFDNIFELAIKNAKKRLRKYCFNEIRNT